MEKTGSTDRKKTEDGGSNNRTERRRSFREGLAKLILTVYETGGIPLVLIIGGVIIALDAQIDIIFDGPSGPLPREIFLAGVGLILAGAACWTFSVFMLQQRESDKLRVIEAIIEAASEITDTEKFFASAESFLRNVGFDATITNIHVPQAQGEQQTHPTERSETLGLPTNRSS